MNFPAGGGLPRIETIAFSPLPYETQLRIHGPEYFQPQPLPNNDRLNEWFRKQVEHDECMGGQGSNFGEPDAVPPFCESCCGTPILAEDNNLQAGIQRINIAGPSFVYNMNTPVNNPYPPPSIARRNFVSQFAVPRLPKIPDTPPVNSEVTNKVRKYTRKPKASNFGELISDIEALDAPSNLKKSTPKRRYTKRIKQSESTDNSSPAKPKYTRKNKQADSNESHAKRQKNKPKAPNALLFPTKTTKAANRDYLRKYHSKKKAGAEIAVEAAPITTLTPAIEATEAAPTPFVFPPNANPDASTDVWQSINRQVFQFDYSNRFYIDYITGVQPFVPAVTKDHLPDQSAN